MPNNWFANRGQVIQTSLTGAALFFAAVQAWPRIQVNDFLAPGPVVFFLISILLLYSIYRLIKATNMHALATSTAPTSPAEPAESRPVSLLSKFNNRENKWRSLKAPIIQSVTIRVGSFWEREDQKLRIDILEIRPVDANVKYAEHAAEVHFKFGGSIAWPGSQVSHIGVNRFIMPAGEYLDSWEPNSVFRLLFTDTFVSMFICHIEHINTVQNEVTLKFCDAHLVKTTDMGM